MTDDAPAPAAPAETKCEACGAPGAYLHLASEVPLCEKCRTAPAAPAPRAEEPSVIEQAAARVLGHCKLARFAGAKGMNLNPDGDGAQVLAYIGDLELVAEAVKSLTAALARATEERDYNARQIEQAALLTESQSGIIADYDDRLKVVQAQLATARAEERERICAAYVEGIRNGLDPDAAFDAALAPSPTPTEGPRT